MMQRNPRAFLRAAATVLRPTTTAVVPRALTSTPQAVPPKRRPLFPAQYRRAFSTSSLGNHDDRPVDIKELPGAYSYVLDVPGLRAGDLTVKLVPDRWLEIMRERSEEKEAGGCIYRRKDRPMGELQHSFRLPQDADLGKMSAVCRDGVLTVTVEKLPPPPVPGVIPRIIEVQS